MRGGGVSGGRWGGDRCDLGDEVVCPAWQKALHCRKLHIRSTCINVQFYDYRN